jgi:hypothetical protein
MRTDSHPIQFAAGEAIADRASVALVAWETPTGFAWRTYPHASLTVLIGLHDVIGHMIDQMRDAEPEEDDAAG